MKKDNDTGGLLVFAVAMAALFGLAVLLWWEQAR